MNFTTEPQWLDTRTAEFESFTSTASILSTTGILIPLAVESFAVTAVVTSVLLALSVPLYIAVFRAYDRSGLDSFLSYVVSNVRSVSPSTKIGIGLIVFGCLLTLHPYFGVFFEFYAFAVVNLALIVAEQTED